MTAYPDRVMQMWRDGDHSVGRGQRGQELRRRDVGRGGGGGSSGCDRGHRSLGLRAGVHGYGIFSGNCIFVNLNADTCYDSSHLWQLKSPGG